MEAIKNILPSVLAGLQTPQASMRTKLVTEWSHIAGPRLAGHTSPKLGREGKLSVWVDQSTLAFELSQRYRQSFLKRVQAVLGEETIKSVHFRVGQLR